MSYDRWGDKGPPLEAYSRVTNPERFEPLVPAILSIANQLDETYDVERVEKLGIDQEIERSPFDAQRPTIRLTPRNRRAAPITIAFSSFPGIHARFGKWTTVTYPGCGCDACDETADSEIERLNDMIHNVTRGRFREAMGEPRIPRQSRKWWAQENWAPNPRRSYEILQSTSNFRRGSSRASRVNVDGIKNWWPFRKKVREIEWEPWPLRS